MKLLVFAHLGEAQSFIDNLKLSQEKTKIGGFYIDSSRSTCLALTGQGLIHAGSGLTNVLEAYPEVTEIINFGVCGKLISNVMETPFEVGQSILREGDKTGEKRIKLADNSITNISSITPILDSELKMELSAHAHTVDMELFSYATVADKFNIKLRSIKHISDDASDEDKEVDFKLLAKVWSDELFKYYQSMYSV